MKIATFNVNSIKAHAAQVMAWLKQAAPDLVALQEIKCLDEAFPSDAMAQAGYASLAFGQKTYNGVAILARAEPRDVIRGLPGFEDDQARYLEAVIEATGGPIRFGCLYLPNGNPAPGPKYDYKLRWIEALVAHAKDRLALEEPFILAGDYNVIPTARDLYDPAGWKDDALFRRETRLAFGGLTALGLTEAFRACNAEPRQYTFFDYQAGAWPKRNGLRIDHFLLSPQAADRLTAAGIDTETRGWEKPSDHVPAWIELAA
ncbi:MAG: exodeoxyribonuclease III [Alphaproteobacteria bacterium]|nr:exodeoxyribonuclease III [Alphaproteobacteria bacterium]